MATSNKERIGRGLNILRDALVPYFELKAQEHYGPKKEFWVTELSQNQAIKSKVQGKKIKWDDEAMRCVGLPEADPLIRREYREGWTL